MPLLWISLAVVLAFVALILHRRTPPSALRVLLRLPLEPRRSLLVVDVAGRTLLLSSSEAGVSMLVELDPAQAAALVAVPQPAPSLLRLALGRRG